MGIRKYKPTSPGKRFATVSTFDEITKTQPEKKLTICKKNTGGRNSQGKISVRHIGGGNKRKIRIIDFKRKDINNYGIIKSIEYDPNRSANIALILYPNGSKKYIIAPNNVNVGDKIYNTNDADIKVGNCLTLKSIPVGTIVHNIELTPGKGGQIARSAGSSATLVAKNDKYATIKMPSGEVRYILLSCKATIGQVGNIEHELCKLGKAGKSRHKNIRPNVRGVVMNPCDHPHGGGEGKSPIGRPSPVSKWGKPTLGYKTRNKKKKSSNMIIKRIN